MQEPLPVNFNQVIYMVAENIDLCFPKINGKHLGKGMCIYKDLIYIDLKFWFFIPL